MVNRVFCDHCGEEITPIDPASRKEDENIRLVARVTVTYYEDVETMKKGDVWSSYEFDLCTEDLAELERTYDIIPVTGEKKEAAEPHV